MIICLNDKQQDTNGTKLLTNNTAKALKITWIILHYVSSAKFATEHFRNIYYRGNFCRDDEVVGDASIEYNNILRRPKRIVLNCTS